MPCCEQVNNEGRRKRGICDADAIEGLEFKNPCANGNTVLQCLRASVQRADEKQCQPISAPTHISAPHPSPSVPCGTAHSIVTCTTQPTYSRPTHDAARSPSFQHTSPRTIRTSRSLSLISLSTHPLQLVHKHESQLVVRMQAKPGAEVARTLLDKVCTGRHLNRLDVSERRVVPEHFSVDDTDEELLHLFLKGTGATGAWESQKSGSACVVGCGRQI